MTRKIIVAMLALLMFVLPGLPVRAEEPGVLLITRVYADPVTGAVMLEGAEGSVAFTNNAGAIFSGFDVSVPVIYTVAENAVIWLPDNLSAPTVQRCVTARELTEWYDAAGAFLTALNVREAFFAAVTLENTTVTMLTLCVFD